jgi:RNA recognition motif-containing protein
MSSDYRPRSGGSSSGGGGGGRRRRGGRGRSGQGRSENRVYSNGSSSSSPKKEQSFLSKLLGWFTGKKSSKPETKSYRSSSSSSSSSSSRPDFKERAPRSERPPREDRPKQEIVPQEIVSPKLYVGNLAYEAAESDLFDLFSKVGAVKNVEVAMDRHSSRSKGFGFVEMETLETAKEAAAKLNRTDFMGRQIVVSGAKVDKRPSQPREADSDTTSHEHEAGSNPDSTI